MATQKSPNIERISSRYLDAWECFDSNVFSVDELETELLRNRDPDDVPDSSSMNQDLYRLTMLGVVDWYGEGEYRIAVPPSADDATWVDRAEEHMSWVRDEINAIQDERQAETETDTSSSDPEVLTYNDGEYMSAFVGPSSDLDGQARYYQAALSPDKHTGVVLRSYQSVASATDELARDICDDQAMSNTDCVYRFEVEDERMESTDGDLEYRVYLCETRLL